MISFIITILICGSPQYLSKDPFFRLPSNSGYQKFTFLKINLNKIKTNPLGKTLSKYYKNPEKVKEIKKVINIGNRNLLEVLGASHDKEGIKYLKKFIRFSPDNAWVSSAFKGLARSLSYDAHKFIVENIKSYEIPSYELKPIFTFIAYKHPELLYPLLDDNLFSWVIIRIILQIPNVTVNKYLYKSLKKKYINDFYYTSYLNKVFPFFTKKEKQTVCKNIFNRLSFKAVEIRSSNQWDYFKILAKCKKSLKDPRWTAYLGTDVINLVALKANRSAKIITPPVLSIPVRELIKEYMGNPSWEKLLLNVLGKIDDEKSIKTVASYILHKNLWLREEALKSLSFGSHSMSGKMLHAASLETAGEEAILYMGPYFHNIKNRKWGLKSINSIAKIPYKYLRAKDVVYRKNSFFALAFLPKQKYSSKWWKVAHKYYKKLEKEKKYKIIAGLLPVFAKNHKSKKLLRSLLNHNDRNIRISAALSLGLRNDKASIQKLFKLANSPVKKLAVNATYSLGRMKGTSLYLRKLLDSPIDEVVSNAVMALIKREYKKSVKGYSCGTIFQKFKKGIFNNTVNNHVFSYLKNRCSKYGFKGFERWVSSMPLFVLKSLLSQTRLNMFEKYEKEKFLYFTRFLNKFHIGQEGKAYKVTLPSGEIYYGFSSLSGVVFHENAPENIKIKKQY
jgi:hypothetical protein